MPCMTPGACKKQVLGSTMFAGMEAWFGSVSADTALALNCAINTLIGGVAGLFIGELYRRFGSEFSNRENFGNLFPILTSITVLIIFVVKSSLALSLGLIGALSIVRFRTAIKNPEELIYLFFCIGVGVALGAELRLLTLLALGIISLFIVGRSIWADASSTHNLVLTLSGDAERFFSDSKPDVLAILKKRSSVMNVQRFDLEDGQVQFRATVALADPAETRSVMSELSASLPGFRVSYVNLEHVL